MLTFLTPALRRSLYTLRNLLAISGLLICAFPAAAQGWPQSYAGAENRQELKGIAIDSAGSVYATGMSYRDDKTRLDYATLKYSAAGQRQWLQLYSGPPDWIPEPRNNYDFRNCDIPVAVCCDSHSNIYVTGTSYDSDRKSPNTHSAATIKYDSDGRVLWVRRYGAAHLLTAMAVDADGNVFITGDTYGYDRRGWYTGRTGWFIMKYDTNGVLKWFNPTKSDFAPQALAVAPSAEIWIAGITYLDVNPPHAIYNQRLPATTTYVMRVTIDSEGRRKGTITADNRSGVYRKTVQLDAHGNLYCKTLEEDWMVHISKFDATGSRLWTLPIAKQHDINHQDDDGWNTAFAIDSHNNLYQPLMGPNYGNDVQRVLLTVYGSDGVLNSSQTQTYTSPMAGFSSNQVAFDNAGHAFVGGTASYKSGLSNLFVILRFDAVQQ